MYQKRRKNFRKVLIWRLKMLGYQPSFWGLIASGLLILVFIAYLIYYLFSKNIKLSPFEVLVLILLSAMTIGIHSLQHEGQEVNYNITW
jgi:hypothetical protein